MTIVNTATGEITESPTILNYEVHPIANCYPLIQGAEFDALVESIRVSGQRVAVVLDKYKRLLDGRNRARACQVLGIDVVESVYYGDDVRQYVLDLNEHRRHMDAGARALVAAKLANLGSGNPTGRNQYGRGTGSPEPVPSEPAISNEDAAKALDVSPSQVKRAKRVIREAPELIPEIESGDLSIRTAESIVKSAGDDVDKRAELLADHKAGKTITATKPEQNRPKSPPKYGGNRRKHLQIIETLTSNVAALAVAAKEITELDATVTAEEAARLTDDLSKQIKALKDLNSLLQERSK